jgi:predicted RecB family nuclease
MFKLNITENIVYSYSICPRKAYLLLYDFSLGKQQEFSLYIDEKKLNIQRQYLEDRKCCQYQENNLTDVDITLNVYFDTPYGSVECIHLERVSKKCLNERSYEPLLFSDYSVLKNEDRVKASFIADILYKAEGIKPKRSVVILQNGQKKTIQHKVDIHLPIIEELEHWKHSKPEIPAVILNKHCCICPFEKECLESVKKNDSINLLANMTKNVISKFESKGIFTVKQLSYLYKPRRRSRFWGEKKPTHQYELQALALRTKKIYTDNLKELQGADTEIFIDVESMPDDKFHYLIGIIVSKSDENECISLWAENKKDELIIWKSFNKIINDYPNAPIYHYGSYEKRVIKELGLRYKTDVDSINLRLCNINEYIYGRIYFPTISNRLKDICNYLGYTWTDADADGLTSIIWRHKYENTQDQVIKKKLITYNQEDCLNLKKLKGIICEIALHDKANLDVIAVNSEDQCLDEKNNLIIKDFDKIIKSAHGKYDKLKISLKKNRNKVKDISDKKNSFSQRLKIDKKVRVVRGRNCPRCKKSLLPKNIIAEKIIVDLVCYPRGVKKTITKYWGYKGRCSKCSKDYNPPGIRKLGKSNTKYGYGIRAWIAYQRLAMRLPYRKISQLLEDSFNITMNCSSVITLFMSMSSPYIKAEKGILTKMLESPQIHVDETLINIHGKIQYIWVFTDGNRVIFKLTSTRDSEIVHQVLKGFKGVLISDFFAGYDAVDCCQQKCLVHLIRDINDALHKFPFDLELQKFILNLHKVLSPIFVAVDHYGLKKRNLRKFIVNVEKFYYLSVDDISYKSEVTSKFQKRFKRYRHSLFVFLERDDIPWNNNMAERALRHLAVQRKISGSFSQAGMVEYLILLGITQTCRFQNKPLLEFLMSKSQDVDHFKGKKNIKGWDM